MPDGKKGGGGAAPKQIAEMRDAPYNPRTISSEAMDGLRDSMYVFGDLSGFVWNKRTGNIVCGHQRKAAIGDLDCSEIEWSDEIKVELGAKHGRFKSVERNGQFRSKDGTAFGVRMVDWPEEFEKSANILANDRRIQGHWHTDLLTSAVADIRSTLPQMDELFGLTGLLDDSLVVEPEPTEIIEITVRKPPTMTWALIGIPTVRFGEISQKVESIAKTKDIICEVIANDG